MQVINIHECKTQLSRLVSEAEGGQTIVIGRNGKPVAMLVPYSMEAMQPRKGGQLKGKIRMSHDFDKPDTLVERLFYEGDLLPGGVTPPPSDR